MEIVSRIQQLASGAIARAYEREVAPEQVVVNATRADQEGDFTVVTFGLAKTLGARPDAIAQRLGEELVGDGDGELAGFDVVKGFLNLRLADAFWRERALAVADDARFGYAAEPAGVRTMIEFSSPNTNKPLHLGHVRNILLGWSLSRLLEATGHEVIRVQIINDRGIAICKSMLAWRKFGGGATPESTGRKSDHFVGDYYVEFERRFQEEYAAWRASEAGQAVLAEADGKDGADVAKAFKNNYFNEHSALGREAREMLRAWEAGDADVRALWAQMNAWVYAGFDATYERIGVRFEKLYYESDTYLLGKVMAERGLEQGAFYRKDDGSVWADLTDHKLDHKIILRADGTSVYITQDLGTAHQRFADFGMDRMIYVTGDEQNYHFQALFAALQKLGEPYADQLAHLGYGMIDLVGGAKMKSREGTVVDADDLMAAVVAEARANADERAELVEGDEASRAASAEQVGLAAIKYYILRVGAKKRMTFNPKESVDLQGATGPYIQYSYVRAHGVSRRAADEGVSTAEASEYAQLEPAERDLVKHLLTLPQVIREAAEALDPAAVAAYAYNLAKGYHRFWHDCSVLSADTEPAKAFRVQLSRAVATALRNAMDLLGIQLPERM